ncbi:hypothetical protein M5G27_25285 [Pseudomonas shahriarae]|jgi:hypothetical protein|uniref:Uncharacterized protein n=1 Tax=Pseudomonas shahriarae TaxID=2745512 RepID=A0A9X4C5T1_9PSED|nr:hypothetical protein [Pseudomonas shahriarae]MDD1010795.1 hypothetical protein [Pseudomonas shahriarae]
MIRTIMMALLVLQGLVFALPAQAAGFDNSSWDALLKQHVTSMRGGQATQVDYAGLKAERGTLKKYLDNLRRRPCGFR